ncbi:MAG: hypothetical protein ACK4VV_15395, partial [Pseudomonas sp.]
MALCALLTLFCLPVAQAQPPESESPADIETAVEYSLEDQRIQARIAGVYQLLEPLVGVEVEVREGVVLLSGSVSNNVQAE